VSTSEIWVGGLGWPYDELLAASLRARGLPASTLGPMDRDAFDRGVAALPRGQCAPALFTTGALLRRATDGSAPGRYLRLHSCGPCRYALFGLGYERALSVAGRSSVGLLDVEQSPEGLLALAESESGGPLLDALLVGDALAERLRRLRPHVRDVDALEARAEGVSRALAQALEQGRDAREALVAQTQWPDDLPRLPARVLPMVQLIGEPFSLHVDGPAQLNLPRVLAAANAEVTLPPLALWIAYQFWIARQPAFGQSRKPATQRVGELRRLEDALRTRFGEIMRAGEVGDYELPDVDHLADLASPHLPSGWRAGYGHVELGLALRALELGRAQLVLSIKSFGCLPSSSVVDAILPAALDGRLPFLALEVTGDGEAARESRLALRLGSARRMAEAASLAPSGDAATTGRAPRAG